MEEKLIIESLSPMERSVLPKLTGEFASIEDIVKKMGSAHKYVTKPYIQGIDIVDFDASADE